MLCIAQAHMKLPTVQVAIANLDLVVLESRTSFEQLPPHILEEIGQQWRSLYPRALAAPATLRGQISGQAFSPNSLSVILWV